MNVIVSQSPIVHVRDGAVFASSQDVAQFFGKEHKAVLRSIRSLLVKRPELGRCNFVPTEWVDEQGKANPAFDMDRDGFTLIAMGFTGDKALEFKLRYIEQFNAMEKALHAVGEPLKPVAPHPAESLAVCNQFLAFTMAALPNLGERSRQALIASTTEYVVGRALIPPPVVDEPFYTTGEIAAEAGVSPQLAGRRANAAGLKTPEYGEVRLSKASHSDKQVEQFYWNEHGRASLLSILRGLQ